MVDILSRNQYYVETLTNIVKPAVLISLTDTVWGILSNQTITTPEQSWTSDLGLRVSLVCIVDMMSTVTGWGNTHIRQSLLGTYLEDLVYVGIYCYFCLPAEKGGRARGYNPFL
ncbi:hypothetical protein RRG08_016376 [Elysia crispata]|uniref:Uncharacterized protein n=1 Tax=Elysia crispata TaxID=231223 RepID=A0AAE1DXZ7_9GAST|nr:hypothetical protein RRG08_016376 [Elysia crispata]